MKKYAYCKKCKKLKSINAYKGLQELLIENIETMYNLQKGRHFLLIENGEAYTELHSFVDGKFYYQRYFDSIPKEVEQPLELLNDIINNEDIIIVKLWSGFYLDDDERVK